MVDAIVPVLMCGGSGTRLWPLSTLDRPKAFHSLQGELSLFQATLRRLSPDTDTPFTAPVIICGERHFDLVQSQLREIGVRPALIVVEPEGRGTCAAAATAAIAAREAAPNAAVLLASIDHAIDNDDAFRSTIRNAIALTTDRMVLFGARPTRPETGYGYMQPGDPLTGGGARRVVRFLEKPDEDTAVELIAGGWLWNTGVFLADADLLATEIARAAPDVWTTVTRAWVEGERKGAKHSLSPEAFIGLPSLSFDRAVVERCGRLAVVEGVEGWSDLGAWQNLYDRGERDEAQNVMRGLGAAVEASRNLLWNANSLPVTMFGVEGLAVIATDREILIMPLDRSQEVGRLAR